MFRILCRLTVSDAHRTELVSVMDHKQTMGVNSRVCFYVNKLHIHQSSTSITVFVAACYSHRKLSLAICITWQVVLVEGTDGEPHYGVMLTYQIC